MSKNLIVILCTFYICKIFVKCMNFSCIDLPRSHLSIYFNTYPDVKNRCLNSDDCVYKKFLLSAKYEKDSCWGYENFCDENKAFSAPLCFDNQKVLASRQNQIPVFYNQADFGYIRQQINQMTVMCEPTFQSDSSLECSKFLRFCRGRNLMMNLTDLENRKEPIRYNTDVLKKGEIGGHCKLHKEKLEEQMEHMGALQSWAPELRFFEEYTYSPIIDGKCDIVIEKPTFIIKIDATSNMYHHFCDFFNLYASLHVNSTHPLAFEKDVHILVWESYTYESSFADAFNAFTDNEIWDLKTFRGHTVCFKNIVFPLLPRMIFGLYYNTPIIQNCEKSGLFQAFSEHILHRLKIPLESRKENSVRITFLARKTKYRRALNEDELLDEISQNEQYVVKRVSFERGITFKEQLEIIRNTDILIGMHGAGLTHLLFLPNWACVFELYNCEDPNCYKDLARLRGVNYLTWEDNSKLASGESLPAKNGAHAKFANYVFDKSEFSRIVKKAAKYVLNNEEFNEFLKNKAFKPRDELYFLVFTYQCLKAKVVTCPIFTLYTILFLRPIK